MGLGEYPTNEDRREPEESRWGSAMIWRKNLRRPLELHRPPIPPGGGAARGRAEARRAGAGPPVTPICHGAAKTLAISMVRTGSCIPFSRLPAGFPRRACPLLPFLGFYSCPSVPASVFLPCHHRHPTSSFRSSSGSLPAPCRFPCRLSAGSSSVHHIYPAKSIPSRQAIPSSHAIWESLPCAFGSCSRCGRLLQHAHRRRDT